MTLEEMLERLKELYRLQVYWEREQNEVNREIQEIRNKLTNSVKL